MYRCTIYVFLKLFVCIGILFSRIFYSYAALEDTSPSCSSTITMDHPLIRAIEANDMKKIRALIRDRQNINDQDFFGYTPLHYAAKRGKPTIVSLLIEAKALLDKVSTRHGNTPLLLAIEAGHTKIVTLLLAAGADITIMNHAGYNALHLAIQQKRGDLVALCLQAAASCNSCTPEGYSPLMLAIQAGSFPIVQQLLKQKNIADLQDKQGYSALHWAIKQHTATIFCFLAESGKFNVNATTHKGVTPLHLIAANPKSALVCLKQLLHCSLLEVNVADCMGSTPLHYAADAKYLKAVQYFVRHAATEVNKQNHAGQTALHYAVQNNHIGIVKQLLTRVGKGVLLSNKKEITPVELAIRHRYTKIYKLLLAHISFIESDESVDIKELCEGA